MIYGSVCSGIEGATVAWHPLGWRPAWYAEVDPFCSALLKHHYPETPNYGDFTQIREGTIDLLVGGTPCQSFSVAGKRAGLDDPRGNLTLEFLALAGRLRPRWVVWENVPGVLSIDAGRTFGTFLGLLGQLGYGFAYRILDAQYFGVPQRRRRVFVVGHLGDWRRAAAVLFERSCLSGHPAPSRETGQDIARCVATGTNSQRYDWETENFVTANPLPGHHPRADLDNDTYVTHSLRADGFDAGEDGTGRGTPLVIRAAHTSANGHGVAKDVSHTIDGAQGHAVMSSGVRRLTPRECERLQGFPDDYTAIPYRGKPAADGPRYRALGNSFAVPVVRWIGERIQKVEAALLFEPETESDHRQRSGAGAAESMHRLGATRPSLCWRVFRE